MKLFSLRAFLLFTFISPRAECQFKFFSPRAGPRSRQPRDPTNRRNARNRKNPKNRMIPGIIQGIRRITETRESRRCFLESREYRECRENREPRGSKETVRGTPSESLQPSDPCILESWDHKNPGNPGRPMCTGRARHHYCKKTRELLMHRRDGAPLLPKAYRKCHRESAMNGWVSLPPTACRKLRLKTMLTVLPLPPVLEVSKFSIPFKTTVLTFANVSGFRETLAMVSLFGDWGGRAEHALVIRMVGNLNLWHQPNCVAPVHIPSSNDQRLSAGMSTREALYVTTRC